MAPAFSHLADRQCGLAGRASGPGSLAAPNAQRNLGPHGGLAPTNLMDAADRGEYRQVAGAAPQRLKRR